MNSNNDQLKILVAKFKQMNMNQRTAACVGLCLFILLIIHIVILKPLNAKMGDMQLQEKKMLDGINESKQKTDAIRAAVQNSIDNPQSAKSRSYKEQEAEVDKALNAFYDELVTPKEMTDVLRQMIQDNKKLSIVSIEGLPLIDVITETQIPENLLETNEAPQLYKRGVTLTFRGNYFEVLNFLKNIENLPKRLIWGELSYTVKEYPVADVKLTVYTLTSNKEWLGG